jgi:flagellar motor switch protein FliG
MTTSLAARDLTGAQKCAIVCLVIGPDESAKILKELSSDEIELVTKEILALKSVEPDIVKAVLQEFQELVERLSQPSARGGMDFARRLLKEAIGENKAGALIAKVREDEENAPFARLRQARPEILAGALKGEHPQTVALVLSHLDGKQASAVLQALDSQLGGEVLFRMARMENVSPDAVAIVEAALTQKLDASSTGNVTSAGGPGAVAKVLNVTGGSLEEELLGAIESRDAEVASQVKALMFTFEDLLLIDAKGIQRLLREIDTKELALAMKAASEELKAHIKSQMSERAGSALDEEIELMGPVRVKDVEASHSRIIEAVRRLETSGEILVRSQGADNEIIP